MEGYNRWPKHADIRERRQRRRVGADGATATLAATAAAVPTTAAATALGSEPRLQGYTSEVEARDACILGHQAEGLSLGIRGRVQAEQIRYGRAEDLDQVARQQRNVDVEPQERPKEGEERLGRRGQLRRICRDEDYLLLGARGAEEDEQLIVGQATE